MIKFTRQLFYLMATDLAGFIGYAAERASARSRRAGGVGEQWEVFRRVGRTDAVGGDKLRVCAGFALVPPNGRLSAGSRRQWAHTYACMGAYIRLHGRIHTPAWAHTYACMGAARGVGAAWTQPCHRPGPLPRPPPDPPPSPSPTHPPPALADDPSPPPHPQAPAPNLALAPAPNLALALALRPSPSPSPPPSPSPSPGCRRCTRSRTRSSPAWPAATMAARS